MEGKGDYKQAAAIERSASTLVYEAAPLLQWSWKLLLPMPWYSSERNFLCTAATAELARADMAQQLRNELAKEMAYDSQQFLQHKLDNWLQSVGYLGLKAVAGAK